MLVPSVPEAIAVGMALCLAAAQPVAAQAHAHHEAGHVPAAVPAVAAPATRYATDAPLRAGMRDIRAAVEALAHYEHGHMGPEQAARLAGQVRGHLNGIIAGCQLPAEADAALHAVIVPLMAHAAALEREPARLDAIPPMRRALADYASRFDDPGFAEPAEVEDRR